MTGLPDALTPAGCNLQDFAFMPLDVVRLRDSDLSAEVTGDEFRAAVLLWCAAWHQVPAASLPDADPVLAQLAGYGRVVREWRKVRDGALRGWIKCADGRLYHPVVAQKAREAWRAKIEQRWRTECARIKKHNQRHAAAVPYPEFEAFAARGCAPAALAPAADGDGPEGQETPSRDGRARQAVQGTGKGTASRLRLPARSDAATVHPEPEERLRAVLFEAGMIMTIDGEPAPAVREAATAELAGWLDGGADFERVVLPTIKAMVAEDPSATNSLKRFTRRIAAAARRQATIDAEPTASGPPAAVDKPGERTEAARIRMRLADELGAGTYRGWVDPVRLEVEAGTLRVVALRAFDRDYLRDHFGVQVRNAARAVLGAATEVEWTVGGDAVRPSGDASLKTKEPT